ncbi:hypothetical protein CVIRNUC_003649 [Coccomyxa viridis]|uniref:Uncharacterized protein n=1 Tax=Coccomyxa viridis TaxID=1274662 RepID=A0AAV1I0A0_9CHLO|nr:hypothetical protein CVIRNUC_003649 [Coccomyxa viridis]
MLQAKVSKFEAAGTLPSMRRYVNDTFGERWDEYADAFSEQMQRMQGVSWETNNWVVLYRVYPTHSADIEASLHPANLRIVLKADAAKEQAILAQDLHRRDRPPAATRGSPQRHQTAVQSEMLEAEREATVRGAILRALMAARDDGAPIDAKAVANEIGVEDVREHIEHLNQQLQSRFDWNDYGRSWEILPRRPLIVYACVREGLSPGQLEAVPSRLMAAKQGRLRAEAERVQHDRILKKWGLEEELCDPECTVQRHDASRDGMLLNALVKQWSRACGQSPALFPRDTVRMDRLSTCVEYQMYCLNRQLPARKQLSWDNISIRWALQYKVGSSVDMIRERPDRNVIVTRL